MSTRKKTASLQQGLSAQLARAFDEKVAALPVPPPGYFYGPGEIRYSSKDGELQISVGVKLNRLPK